LNKNSKFYGGPDKVEEEGVTWGMVDEADIYA